MKKAIIILLVIVAACFLCANLNYLMSIIDAMQGGALIPLVIACIIMVARHVVQAMSYNEAFGAVGQKTGLWHNIVLIFSLVFINTFCLFSGATGVAFIIDDAHRKGLDKMCIRDSTDWENDKEFNEHRDIYILTPEGNYYAKSFSLLKTNGSEPIVVTQFASDETYQDYIQKMLNRSMVRCV